MFVDELTFAVYFYDFVAELGLAGGCQTGKAGALAADGDGGVVDLVGLAVAGFVKAETFPGAALQQYDEHDNGDNNACQKGDDAGCGAVLGIALPDADDEKDAAKDTADGAGKRHYFQSDKGDANKDNDDDNGPAHL